MKMRSIRHIKVNKDRDYIRVGTCSRCRKKDVSIVVHHPPSGDRPFSICNYCSKDLWDSVGESNKENFLKWGSVTKQRKRSNHRQGDRSLRKNDAKHNSFEDKRNNRNNNVNKDK